MRPLPRVVLHNDCLHHRDRCLLRTGQDRTCPACCSDQSPRSSNPPCPRRIPSTTPATGVTLYHSRGLGRHPQGTPRSAPSTSTRRTIARTTQLRAVASIDFNPHHQLHLQRSPLLLQRHPAPHTRPVCSAQASSQIPRTASTIEIGGIPFTHGYDEHGWHLHRNPATRSTPLHATTPATASTPSSTPSAAATSAAFRTSPPTN